MDLGHQVEKSRLARFFGLGGSAVLVAPGSSDGVTATMPGIAFVGETMSALVMPPSISAFTSSPPGAVLSLSGEP